jgi:hypothetical protein
VIDRDERWKDAGGLSCLDKRMLSQGHNEKIYEMLHKVLYSEDKDLIKKMSLQLFKEFMRFFKTADQGT